MLYQTGIEKPRRQTMQVDHYTIRENFKRLQTSLNFPLLLLKPFTVPVQVPYDELQHYCLFVHDHVHYLQLTPYYFRNMHYQYLGLIHVLRVFRHIQRLQPKHYLVCDELQGSDAVSLYRINLRSRHVSTTHLTPVIVWVGNRQQ